MSTRWARFARGWIVAVFSTFVAALSHTLGGGAVPGVLPVVVSLAFAGMACVALSGRTLSLWRLVPAVLVSQLLFHGLFSLGGSGGRLVAADAHAAHTHAAGQVMVMTDATGAAAAAGHHGVVMLLAHLGAGLVTVLALRFGERAFWGLFDSARVALHALLIAVLPAAVPTDLRHTAPTAPLARPRDLVLLLSPMRHRGPPAPVFA